MDTPLTDINYALMRHTADDGEKLTSDSSRICVANISLLAEKIQFKKVKILHSPQARAVLTAELVASIFRDLGFETLDLESLNILNDGEQFYEKDYNYSVNVYIKVLVSDHPDTFILLISHRPNVCKYLGLNNRNKIPNNGIYGLNFSIEEGNLEIF